MQATAVSRKKALHLLLSGREAKRIGVSVDDHEVQALIESFRANNFLLSEESLNKWRVVVGLDASRFQALMRECAVVAKLENILSEDISAAADEQLRIELARQAALADLIPVPRPSASAGWLQVNVSLCRRDGNATPAALALFDSLREQLPKWRIERTVSRFFFVRKPPDARLRLLCPTREEKVANELKQSLQQLQREGFVGYFFSSCYEPEQARFGGPEAMDLVHDYFDADTSQWLPTSGDNCSPKSAILETLTSCAPSDVECVYCGLRP